MSDQYLCQPEYGLDRLDKEAYTKAKKITDKWEPISKANSSFKGAYESLCGNVRPVFNTETKRFGFSGDQFDNPKYVGMYRVISSALLFYRLFTLWAFQWNVCDNEGKNRYKCIWWLTIKHKETGDILQFGEWKGAAGTWTVYHNHKELKPTFKKDILELLNFIVSDKVPHPYDGCVAGSVA